MALKAVVPGLYQLGLGGVNCWLIDGGPDEGLTLVDTGVAGSAPAILEAVGSLGRSPADVKRVVVTHCHSDHAGGLAAVKHLTGAQAWMHPTDAALVRAGETLRPLTPAPGLVNGLIARLILRAAPRSIEAAEVEHEVADGQVLPFAGGLTAVHAPGHCAGQVCLLWPRHGGVLIAADAAANAFGLNVSPAYEDFALGLRSLAKLAALEFAVACFGHGKPITAGASDRFRRKWGTPPAG